MPRLALRPLSLVAILFLMAAIVGAQAPVPIDEEQEIARTVWPFVESGELRPLMDRSFPLVEAAAAHAYMESGNHIGKIVLTV